MAKAPKKTEDPGIGSNSGADPAREAALLRHVDQLRGANNAIEMAQGAVKNAKKAAKIIRNAAKTDGFTLKILDEALKREGQGNAREQQSQEEERTFVFRTLGLPCGPVEQGELNLTPHKRNEKYWADDGYRAGLQGKEATPPDGMPAEHMQVWLRQRAAGVERVNWALAEEGHNPERAPGSHGGGPTADEIAREHEDEVDPLLTA